jgi:Tfp pilus assembly protein FimV
MTATLHTAPPSRLVRVDTRRPVRVGGDERVRAGAPNYAARRIAAVVLVVVTLAAAAVLAGEVVGAVVDLGGRPAAASEVPLGDPSPAVHVAVPGDSLWSIAELHRGDVGRDRYVDALVALNGGTVIQAGQAVRLP